MSKYNEVMEHVHVTEEMQERVVKNVVDEMERRHRRTAKVVYLRRYAVLAACLVLLLLGSVITSQGGLRRPDATPVETDAITIENLPAPEDFEILKNRAKSGMQPTAKDLDTVKALIEYPTQEDYFESFSLSRVKAPDKQGISGFQAPDGKEVMNLLPDGEEVAVLARHGDYSCVIVLSEEKAYWVRNEDLVGEDNESPAPEGADMAEEERDVSAAEIKPENEGK